MLEPTELQFQAIEPEVGTVEPVLVPVRPVVLAVPPSRGDRIRVGSAAPGTAFLSYVIVISPFVWLITTLFTALVMPGEV